ncbi:uncharacterized protein EDB91DRAFT_1085179 [Suillus paluster]|uniref:uncharacterized protein n=1 Tax=Suillus paluster TaxID=48578 RepID=UPI001B87B7B0|nr:uncharacterized protein EDB91DRAFT_1085179 [Suillus paluster]KAG1731054.1 hypothetical protein EDB91DRAFT_1085179 [Suillus paluster]
MSQDSCALNAYGSLKDASEIKFYNDPDDDVPLPQVPSAASMTNAFSILLKAGRTPATVTGGSWHSGCPTKPSAHVHDADNACSSSSGTRKCDDEVVPSSPPDLDKPGKPSSDEPIPQPDNDKADEAQSKSGDTTQTVSKSECTAGVHTIFTRASDRWVCNLCKAAGEPVSRHTFHGGTSTLWTHIYTHPSLTEKDIPHHTKLMNTIKSRVTTVGETIKNCLAVGWMMPDNASNNDTAMREVARVINEDDEDAIIEDGFDVGDAVGKALALIKQICKSPQAQAFFRKLCKEEGVAVRKILTWVRTRWASLFKCLKRFLSLCLFDKYYEALPGPALHVKEPMAMLTTKGSIWYESVPVPGPSLEATAFTLICSLCAAITKQLYSSHRPLYGGLVAQNEFYSDGEEAPRHPKCVPVPSAKVVSADNTAELELPSHRNAHNASRTASAALRPSSHTQTPITEFERDDHESNGELNLKRLSKGKKCARTPKDDNESPPPDEPDIPHVRADDDVDAEGFLKDIKVMDIDEPEKPRQEHRSKDINNFFFSSLCQQLRAGKEVSQVRIVQQEDEKSGGACQ